MSPMTNSSARKRRAKNTPRIYPGDVIDVDGRIIRIPKETPVTKHPETTTEWLEDIALELHAITGLLNERLPVVHLSFSAAHASTRADYIRMARAARERIEAERPPETDWEGLFGVEQRKREKAEAELETVKTTLRNVEARRDALLHETDNLLSRTRDECDKYADKAERWAARYAALREDVDRERINAPTIAGTAPLTRILARDDERGGDQS